MIANLNDVLLKAKKEKYAVGLFNTTDTDMLQAAIEAAEELRSPIIIGTAEVLLPYGDLRLIAPPVVEMAKQATVPVVVHYDHGLTKERCKEALARGFSSIMFDGSLGDYDKNCQDTREMAEYAHKLGASIEGEIGHVGNADGVSAADRYTTVEEAKLFLEATGVDALAVAIGTAHGLYKTKPQLDFARLNQISNAVSVPLVIHGGSGLSDDDFKMCVQAGASKINIFTDLTVAGMNAMKQGVKDGMDYLSVRNLKKDAVKQAIMAKMALFGSVGKA